MQALGARRAFLRSSFPCSRSSSSWKALGNCRAPSIVRLGRRGVGAIRSMAYEDDVRLAIKAVSLASRLCQAVQRKLVANETQAKADQSPVTVADYGSQALVSWVLERELPPGTFHLIAEEDSEDLRAEDGSEMLKRITQLVNETIAADGSFGSTVLSEDDVLTAISRGDSPGGPSGRYWVLDPIDGTRGFVRGDQYAVALGLLDNGEVVAGVLGCPNLPLASIAANGAASDDKAVGCVFAASRGAGTVMQSMDGSREAQRVYVSSVDDSKLAAFCESFEAAHSKQGLTANIARILGVSAPPIRIDSQAKYGAMARGDAVIYLRFPHAGYREKIWDHAAGLIVITEAGGEVFDAAGKPLDFSKGRFLDLEKGIIATNPSLRSAVLAAVQTAIKEEESALKGVSPL
ncbi:hypothetical protein AXG93_4697s1090 [Marchantia polymorpha subsp. ruderalis]|uniref:3'(2'),5'-bisphosphate nucleotidase n=1 Tax=Marchantia polymorpha subsp. ruderalis TaxID=1480154 RepID=A0A176VPY3_MARPO|nr:hypothetical protein AXG93_4697s1090 [Marchantia polymorpha subsp. ruderalis]